MSVLERRGWEISAEREIREAVTEPSVPCSIIPECRGRVCLNPAEHLADLEVLLSCGHSWAYCFTAWHGTFEPVSRRDDTISCRCAPHQKILLVRNLR